jgi:hypothetical protein
VWISWGPINAPHDLIGRFRERPRLVGPEELLGEPSRVPGLAGQEGVVVRDHDLRAIELLEQIGRQEVALAVVVVRIVREEHPQPVPNGDPRADDQERVAEPTVLRVGELVQRLPRHEHPHHHRLARAPRHLQRDAEEVRVPARLVRLAQLVDDPGVAVLRRDLGNVDRGLQRLDLTEEELSVPLRVRPVVEEPRGGGRHARVVSAPPDLDLLANAVDELVLLQPILGPLGLERELRGLAAAVRNRHEIAGSAPRTVDDLPCDPAIAELEVARGLPEGGVDHRILDDDVGHGRPMCPERAGPGNSRATSCLGCPKRVDDTSR